MGCTSSKENTNPPPTTINDDDQQLINDHFRKWLKSNRPKADEYVLNDVISTAQSPNEIDDYRTIVRKALDLLSERYDIKTTNKLSKLVQKEVSLASPKKVAHTINILKQTADKVNHGQIVLDGEQQQQHHQPATTTNGEVNNKHGLILSGDPGIALKEALETARILFYKGKQAAIFANPNGGYDVRIIDENDDGLNQDGNLLRSIIVTEVKMRPKPVTVSSHLFNAPPPPPPPPSKLLDEHEIGDDFRRSIDAALKGLEVIYQTSPPPSSEHTQEIHVDKKSSSKSGVTSKASKEDNLTGKSEQAELSQIDIQPKLVNLVDSVNDLMLDTIETTTQSEIGNPIPPTHYETVEKLVTVITHEQIERSIKEMKEHGGNYETKESLPTKTTEQSSSYSLGLTSPIENEESTVLSSTQQKAKLSNENRPKSFVANEGDADKDHYNINKQISLDELVNLTQTGLSNPNSSISTTKLGISTSSGKIEEEPIGNTDASTKLPTSISQIIEEHNKILSESSSPPVIAPIDTNTTVKSPSHNVTYTEIIHSESHDGEQSRRFITESYDDHPCKDDEQTTTLKVVTKSEFSNHPSLGEKIMEQSVQVITVKVRNETVKTTISPQPSDNDIAYEKQSVNELVKNDANKIDTTT